MCEVVSVSVSGLAFSTLSYENIKCEHGQEGFLLGNVICKESNRVTDADHQVIDKEYIIQVKSLIPCPHQFYFYNAAGKIDEEKIKQVINDQHNKVVGWYIFKRKRHLHMKLTFREKIIHKQLANLFSLPMSQFTCCLLTLEYSNNKSTHVSCQTFLRYWVSKYESLPLHLINLTNPKYIFQSAKPVSDILTKLIIDAKQSQKVDESDVAEKVQDGLQHYMKGLVEKCYKKEQELFKLEQQVKQLKQNIIFSRDHNLNKSDSDHTLAVVEITENGVTDDQPSEPVMQSPDILKKKRIRPRKGGNPVQNNDVNKNILKICDADGDYSKDNLTIMARPKTRSQTKANYTETTPKK